MNEAEQHKTDSEIALLAPVPLQHLTSALNVDGWVAFGSMNFEVFDQLEKQRDGYHVDAYIYASQHDGSSTSQYWRGTYIGVSTSYHDVSEHRPASTKNETGWGMFWRIKDLMEVSLGEWRIDQMQGFGKTKKYNKFFVPEGPLLIQHPKSQYAKL